MTEQRSAAQLHALVAGRDVALVGNASSLFARPRPIDRHEIVVRMNWGFRIPAGLEAVAGRRTDVLLVSGMRGDEILNAARHVVWMTPKRRDELSEEERQRFYFYPTDWWNQLSTAIDARPSTGCMAVDLLARINPTGRLTLYGFDFWRSPTWYTNLNLPGPHVPSNEEAYVRSRLPNGQITIME